MVVRLQDQRSQFRLGLGPTLPRWLRKRMKKFSKGRLIKMDHNRGFWSTLRVKSHRGIAAQGAAHNNSTIKCFRLKFHLTKWIDLAVSMGVRSPICRLQKSSKACSLLASLQIKLNTISSSIRALSWKIRSSIMSPRWISPPLTQSNHQSFQQLSKLSLSID